MARRPDTFDATSELAQRADVAFALFVSTLDNTVVNVARPQIGRPAQNAEMSAGWNVLGESSLRR